MEGEGEAARRGEEHGVQAGYTTAPCAAVAWSPHLQAATCAQRPLFSASSRLPRHPLQMQKAAIEAVREAFSESKVQKVRESAAKTTANKPVARGTTHTPTRACMHELIAHCRISFSSSPLLLLQDIAARIKKKFDNSYPSTTWHCIVGNHFAVSITHQTKYLCFLEVSGQSILLFKSQE